MGPTSRILTPARAVALTLIAIVVAILGYIRVGTGPDRPAVPDGAAAGDLTMEPCTYDTEAGGLAADCGTLVVPENRLRPGSRLIALPVTRIRATGTGAGAPVFRLEGGPGRTNTRFPQAARFAAGRDVVLVGYRGVDGSSELACPEVSSALRRSEDLLGAASSRRYADAFQACASRLRGEGVDLGGYTLSQRADDLEDARVALGYGAVDLLSESAGTRTAMIYSWRHPRSVRRSVMIGANPPGHFLWHPRETDAQIARYTRLCAADASCRARTDDLGATIRRGRRDIPGRWGPFRIKEGNVRVSTFYGLPETGGDAAPFSSPQTLDSWLAASEGDAGGFWFMSLAADLVFPDVFVWGDVAAVGRADAEAARRHFRSGGRSGSVLGDPGTRFIWGDGRLVDAWPAAPGEAEYRRVRTSRTETLVIGGSLDSVTPPQVATRELMPHLPNGHQVVLPGIGHTVDFWSQQRPASTRLISAFLDTGRVDASLYRPQRVDLTPGMTQPTIARIVAGSLAGVALLTLGALLWLPRRIRRRGAISRRWAPVLRSAYAALLGVGGWVVGSLVVLTALPGVSPLDPRLIVPGVAVPVALAVHWGWVRRDLPAGLRRLGLVAGGAGALAGAWLGSLATSGLPALVTGVAGAVAGANLALIALDMGRAHALRRAATASADPARVSVPASSAGA